MDKIAVLIPCYNESQTIKKVVEDLEKRVAGSYNLCVRQQFFG